MAKVREGDGLSAAAFNRHEEVADWYFRSVARGEPQLPLPSLISTGRIKIKNSSGATRRQGEILKVGDYLLAEPASNRKLLVFDASLHDGKDSPFAVLLEPIPDGQFGWSQIAGVCLALVNFTHADQRYARPAANNDVLQGGALGQVRILHKPSGTGEKECLVLLGDGRFEAIGLSDEVIAGGDSGTINILTGPGGSETDSGLDEECFVLGQDGTPIDIKGGISLINNVLYFTPTEGCA